MSKPHRITIVDDDELLLEATEGLIRSLGHHADTFASAEAYLNCGRVGDTACLITDVQMPGMSGIDLQHRLLAEGFRIPVIVISGILCEKVRAAALAAGAVCFLNKPVDIEHLVRCLNRALGL